MRNILILCLSLAIISCGIIHRMDIEQGNIINSSMVNRLHLGMSRNQVVDIMGTPVLVNTFADNRMSYVYTFQPGNANMSEKSVILTFRNNRLINMTGNMVP